MKFELSLDEDFELKLGAHTWKIMFVDLKNELSEEHAWGVCCSSKQMIHIDKNAPYSMKLSTIFHELIHAMEDIYEVKLDHRDLNLIGDVLAQIMLDNFVIKEKPAKKKKR